MKRYLIPAALFVVLIGFLAVGLKRDPRDVPSPLVGKPAPAFTLPQLDTEKPFSTGDLRGQVWLLNVWASWCVACRQEHPVLVDLARRNVVPVVGLNYKEVRGDGGLDVRNMALDAETTLAIRRARGWLTEHGDPYVLSVLDIDGRIGIDFGVYGVPETFLIDREGVIRYKHIGPITPASLREQILPRIEELNRAS